MDGLQDNLERAWSFVIKERLETVYSTSCALKAYNINTANNYWMHVCWMKNRPQAMKVEICL